MNPDERKKLEEIHQDVRETRTRTRVIDERTKHLDSRIERVEKKGDQRDEQIETNRSNIRRNTTIVGGFLTVLTSVTLWASDKVAKII
jgi:chromosome segregation ATPase